MPPAVPIWSDICTWKPWARVDALLQLAELGREPLHGAPELDLGQNLQDSVPWV